jgi:hypothetical protein
MLAMAVVHSPTRSPRKSFSVDASVRLSCGDPAEVMAITGRRQTRMLTLRCLDGSVTYQRPRNEKLQDSIASAQARKVCAAAGLVAGPVSQLCRPANP